MIVANNLARAGHEVTFYSDTVSSLNRYVDNYQIKPLLSYEAALNELSHQHLVLYHSSSPFTENLPDNLEAWFKQNAICYRLSRSQPIHHDIEVANIKQRLPESDRRRASDYLKFNSRWCRRRPKIPRGSIVKQLTRFLVQEIGLKAVTEKNGLRLPIVRRSPNKVVIHPHCSSPNKQWNSSKYIQLARSLKKLGYDPSFIVSPAERAAWEPLINHEFRLPIFNTAIELAEYYQNASYSIGGDSGHAHLASCLGVPTIQIFRSWKKYPSWRAGWAENSVIVGRLPYCLSKGNWQAGVSVKMVINEFKRIVAINEKK